MGIPVDRLTFVVLGDIDAPPAFGTTACHPLAAPRAGALYRARIKAMCAANTEFVCLLDGGGDILLPGFEASVARRMEAMRRTGAAIGYADEFTEGRQVASGEFTLSAYLRHPLMMHHGVVCRTDAVKAIDWPAGCHWFEAACYGTLAQQGYVYDRAFVYDWRPSPNGARLWADTARGMHNSLRWLQGLPGMHFSSDFTDC